MSDWFSFKEFEVVRVGSLYVVYKDGKEVFKSTSFEEVLRKVDVA